jgi:hypothetical protein
VSPGLGNGFDHLGTVNGLEPLEFFLEFPESLRSNGVFGHEVCSPKIADWFELAKKKASTCNAAQVET